MNSNSPPLLPFGSASIVKVPAIGSTASTPSNLTGPEVTRLASSGVAKPPPVTVRIRSSTMAGWPAFVWPEVTGLKVAEMASISTLPPLAVSPSRMLTPDTVPPLTTGAPELTMAVSPEVGTTPLFQLPESNQLPLVPIHVSVSVLAIPNSHSQGRPGTTLASNL
jgi:hypothetical protein